MSVTQDFLDRFGLSAVAATNLVADSLKGADDGELYCEDVWDEAVSRSSQPKPGSAELDIQTNSSYSEDGGFGLRRVVDGNFGYQFATDFTANAVKDAGLNLRAVFGVSPNTLFPAPQSTAQAFYGSANPLTEMSYEDKFALLEQIDDYARSQDPRVRRVNVALIGSLSKVLIVRPDGFMADDIRPQVQLRITIQVEEDGRTEAGSSAIGGRTTYADITTEANWKHHVGVALSAAVKMLKAEPCPSGEMPVVLGNGWAGVLLHEAIGHPLEGDANAEKTSNFHNKMGQKVASDGVTIVDSGHDQDARGALNFDDEGTPTEVTTLIEDGKLVGLMHDRISARKLGTKSTGSGRRESFRHPVLPRMRNTFMQNGDMPPEDIISQTKNGIYITDFSGGSVQSATGQFVFNAKFAMLIENGKLTTPLKGGTLIGNPYEALMHMDMIGNDLEYDAGVGMCGKQGQSLPVNLGQPTLRLMGGVAVGGAA